MLLLACAAVHTSNLSIVSVTETDFIKVLLSTKSLKQWPILIPADVQNYWILTVAQWRKGWKCTPNVQLRAPEIILEIALVFTRKGWAKATKWMDEQMCTKTPFVRLIIVRRGKFELFSFPHKDELSTQDTAGTCFATMDVIYINIRESRRLRTVRCHRSEQSLGTNLHHEPSHIFP